MTAFDADYYRRFYVDDPVHDEARIGSLMQGVFGLAAWWGITIRSVLDIGAGLGLAGRWLADQPEVVTYRGVDVSRHACRQHGHKYADISVWRPGRPSDLVLCISVLQYLDDDAVEAAIVNLAAATRHLLYLEVPTTRDRSTVIDLARTDVNVHWRSGAWYRRRFAPLFAPVGAGLWLNRKSAIALYELEAAKN
jgi:hypothetical protein